MWVIVWQWIPRHPVVVGLGAVALGGFNLIDADNRDFVILRDAFPGLAPDLVLLVGLVFVFGASLVWVDRWFGSIVGSTLDFRRARVRFRSLSTR